MSAPPQDLHYLAHLARLGATDLHPGGRRGSEQLAHALELRPGQRVLEIGCGTGQTLVRLGCSHRITIHGVDRLPAMLATARRRLVVTGACGRPALVRADGSEGLPFADAAYDRVYAESVLGFQPPDEATLLLEEIHRVLRPAGLFVANDAVWRSGTDPETVARVHATSLEDFGLAQASSAGWTREDWIRRMEGVGFRVRSSEPLEDSGATTVSMSRPWGEALAYGRAMAASAAFTFARRVRGLLTPNLLRARLEYRRRLARHREDGRHVEGCLFVLDKSRGGV
jgi:SAM-dependent methyltransferase